MKKTAMVFMFILAVILFGSASAGTEYDVPDAMDYISEGFDQGQFGNQSANKFYNQYHFYSYDDWSDPFADVTSYLDLFDGEQVPFRLIGVTEDDYISTSASYNWLYYYEYTGDKKIPAVKFRIQDDKYECHMQISVSRRYADNKTTISVRLVPELTYAGADRKADASSNHSSGGSSTSGYQKPTKPQTPCIKCHGNKEITCTACDGKCGSWEYSNSAIGGNSGRTWHRCSKCNGTGRITCTRCKGTGKE